MFLPISSFKGGTKVTMPLTPEHTSAYDMHPAAIKMISYPNIEGL